MHGAIAHVTAYQPLALGAALKGLHIQVPAVARVQTRGKAIVGMLGDPAPASDRVETEARAFAQALLRNGDITGVTGIVAAARAVARGRRPVRRATHEVKMIGGRRTIVRRGLASRWAGDA